MILRTWATKLHKHLHKALGLIFTMLALTTTGSIHATTLDLKKSININNLVILQYHHVSTETPKSTSVSPKVFSEHMAFLAANYHIIDLADAITKLQNNQSLPNKSVAITFDDGYINILENAHPILKKHNFPYTVFINPAIINESRSQLTWQQIKQMQPLATFANHTLDHVHLLTNTANENNKQWLTRVMNNINQAEQIIAEKVGYSKKWLAFPYGEYNTALKQQLLSEGYIGFGQQSGAVGAFSDFGALPRYPAAGVYANLDSLKTKLDSLAMPVNDLIPVDTQYSPTQSLSELTFSVVDKDVRLTALACYFKGQKLEFKKVKNAITVSVNHQLTPGRERINCTAPSNGFPSRYYWFSYPMFTATSKGEYLD